MSTRARALGTAAGAAIAMLSGGAAAASAAPDQGLGVLGDDERRQASDRSAVNGPFVPVAGRVDYGTAENRFGAARSGHMHEGQDMFSATGTALVAVTDGIVLEAGADAGRGNYAAIYDPRAQRTYVYFHMLAPADVRAGETVAAGARVGALGCTGSCWGAHLHFEVHEGRDPYGPTTDPLPLVRGWIELAAPL